MKKQQIILLAVGFLLLFILLSFQRLSKSQIITIETPVSSDKLWTTVTNTIQQSSSSPLWPQSFGSLSTPEVQNNSQVIVKLNTITGPRTITFIITSMQYGVLEYVSESTSPIPIRGVITVIPREKTSALSWSHQYVFNIFNPVGWYVHMFYLPSFYEAIEKQLQ